MPGPRGLSNRLLSVDCFGVKNVPLDRLGAFGDLDPTRFQRLGDLALQLDVQHAVFMHGAGYADMISEVEAAFEQLRREPRYAPFVLLGQLSSPTRRCAREWADSQLVKVPGIEGERGTYVAACETLFADRDAIPHKRFRDDWIAQLKMQSR